MKTASSSALALAIACLFSSSHLAAQETDGVRRLTYDPAQDGFPSWSPDGRQLVFSRYGGDEAPEKTGLYLVSPDGGEPQRLTSVIGEHPDWSPDGHYIAFDGDFGNRIQLVAASGGTPVRIVPETIRVLRGGQPKWSPDGSRIVFKEGETLWLLDVAAGSFEEVFSEPGKLPIPACWSPDGQQIYLFLRDAETRRSSIWAISATGRGKRRVTPEDEGVYRYADLSPDGSLLVVVRCEGRECNLGIMSSSGGDRVPITPLAGYDDGPSWSPDGSTIAFVSTRSGNFDIWTIEVDVEQVRRQLQDLTP